MNTAKKIDPSDKTTRVGKRLIRLRKHLGLSRNALVDLLGVSFDTYRSVERGINLPSYPILSKIASHPLTSPYIAWLVQDGENDDDEPINANTINNELLAGFLVAVEKALKAQRKTLPDNDKGELVAFLYNEYNQKENNSINMDNVIQLVNYTLNRK